MQQENKLERRKLNNSKPRQTTRDYQDSSKDYTLATTIGIGLAMFFGHKAYKSGALRGLSKSMLEVSETIINQGVENSYTTMSTIKKWTNIPHYNSAQIKALGIEYNAPQKSLFRLDSNYWGDNLKFAASDIYDAIHGNFRFKNSREFLQGTIEDVNMLKTMLEKERPKMAASKKLSKETDIYKDISEMLDFDTVIQATAKDADKEGTMSFTSKYIEELIKERTLTAEAARQMEKQSGYRYLTLGDVVRNTGDRENPFEAIMDRIGYSFDITSGGDKSLLEKFNELAKNDRFRFRDSNGKLTKLPGSQDWENIIIDKGLYINQDGKILDTRITRHAKEDLYHSLAKDFGLPVVGFNPLKMIGLGQYETRSPFGGYISPEQFMPSLTRQGGEVKIGEFLANTFGKEFRESSVAVINGNAYIRNPNNNKLINIASNLKLHNVSYADSSFGLKASVNAERQIANLDIGHAFDGSWEQYKRKLIKEGIVPTKSMEYKYKTAKFLDLGFQESRFKGEENLLFDIAEMTSMDELTNDAIYNITSKFKLVGHEYNDIQEMIEKTRTKNMKTVLGNGFQDFVTSKGKIYRPKMYYAQTKGYEFKNVLNSIKANDTSQTIDSLKYFVGQFGPTTGLHKDSNIMSKYFTEYSTIPWNILNALSEGIGRSSYLFGLSTKNKSSTGDLMKNLLLRRALPVYGLLQLPGMINYFSEPVFGKDEDGNPDNLGKFLMRKVSKIDIAAHKIMDLTNATKLFKFMGEMTPGSDQISELPGIYQLGLGQTTEERKEYIENGVDPIRKGRWWGSGNTPFTGGKIMYFRPNVYRRVQADVKFSDSKWGSRQEYYNHTWYPNLVNPLAPINYFFLNKNHYDKKHYYDRPYLQTAPIGSNIPIIGPMFSETVGKIISPPRRMHKEYWDNDTKEINKSEQASYLLIDGNRRTSFLKNISNSRRDIDTIIYSYAKTAQSMQAQNVANERAVYLAKQLVYSANEKNKNNVTYQHRIINPLSFSTKPIHAVRDDNNVYNPFEVYVTPSGSMNIVDIPSDLDIYEVNRALKTYSINKIYGTNQRVNLINDFQGPDIPTGSFSTSVDNAFLYNLGEQYNMLGDVAGLKGFALQQFITGHPNENARIIENSGYAYSVNNDFWNQNLGGLGGNLSEITRRFIQERNKNTEYINPIRNTMPLWMPGSNYFTDFLHGDPYTKVMNGEERLPGEGYERLHKMNNVGKMYVNYEDIGRKPSDIILSLLHKSNETEDEILNKKATNDIRSNILNAWKDEKLLAKRDIKIQDDKNGIHGTYDAILYDTSNPYGIGIANIRAVSAKDLRKIKLTGSALQKDKEQINYALYANQTPGANGYVYYFNRDNPNKYYMAGVSFNEKLLKKSLNDIYFARSEITDEMSRGKLGRGELYDPIERYRILADVAPYSQEFKDASAQVSMMKLTDEQKKDVSQIRKRVTQQKEPLRVYDYKFKTANLQSERVKVTKVLDNNTILVKQYGKEHAIKFAGINVSEDNSTFYKSKKVTRKDKRGIKRKKTIGITMNDAAKKEISKYIRPGMKIQIAYDADDYNKFSKDSTSSIRAVVYSRNTNVNRMLINKNLATVKENDDSPAAINARYTKGEIAFGSAMEHLTHSTIGNIPFVGSKILQVRSPYESYRKREVYGKDFQSWNTPISSILIPSIEQNIADNRYLGIGGIVSGAFIGSMFGAKHSRFGRLVGGFIGGAIPAIGKAIIGITHKDKERDWRPKRRVKQENLNEYVDILKYIKNMKLYEEYKVKAKKENNFDVEKYIKDNDIQGVYNKAKKQELIDFKKKVKLDFKHRKSYNFNYGKPKYVTKKMTQKETISAINKEIAEIQNDRRVDKLPVNVVKAIGYKQQAEKTMYGYKPGDSLVNIMSALPKKDRQYFKHFIKAPEEEKEKILRIAPSYMRRALQSSWGMKVDKKPTLDEYFQTHGLPGEDWVGWDEDTNLDDVKVKLVHNNKLDPGEFDIWKDTKIQADKTNIPIPEINAKNTRAEVQNELKKILTESGYNNIQIQSIKDDDTSTTLELYEDAREEISNMIDNMLE